MVEHYNSFETDVVDFDPFSGPELVSISPATESQKEIWISCVLGGEPANKAFNESVSLRFTGSLQKQHLETAFCQLIERHEMLRAAFSADGSQICIFKSLENPLENIDISKELTSEQSIRISGTVAQHINHVFDLVKGPLCRFTLLQLSPNEFYLVITVHHIICDGWSLNILLKELSELYSAIEQKRSVALPAADSFTTYATEQLSFFNNEEYNKTGSYWIDQYKDDVPVLELPIDHLRPLVRNYNSARIDYKLDKAIIEDVQQLANKSGCSFVTTLIATFEVFLHLLTQQETIVLGLPASGQAVTGKFNLIGHCVNLLPLKSTIDIKSTFFDHLLQRRKYLLDAFENQQLTFGSLLKKISVVRDPSRVALVPVVFNVDMGMLDGIDFSGLQFEFSSNPRAFETFEIFLNLTGSQDFLTFEWSYNTHLFQAQTINNMMEGLKNIFKSVVENPSVVIEELQANNREQSIKLNRWNTTATSYPHNKTIHRLINETVDKFPNKTALVFANENISYKALNKRVNQFAHYLIKEGIGAGDIVGLAVERSPEMLISLLAILKSAAAFVPLDVTYPQERIKYMLDDSSAKSMIISKKHKGNYGGAVKMIFVEDIVSAATTLPDTEPAIKVFSASLAYVLYTSGSTGKPKGVLVAHRNVVNMLCSLMKMPGICSNDILLAVTTISFDIAYVEMFLPLIAGATIYLANSTAARNGRELLQIVKDQKISIMQATPSTYKMMIAAGWEQRLPVKILCGGEPMSKDLADKLLARCSSLYNMYGPTETTVYSTGKQVFQFENIITIGKPIQNTQVYILDENLNEVPEGATGEIYIAGDGVAHGYLNMPNLTAEKFINDPFLKEGKMYKTGDLGKFLSNGEIHCLGRVDRQIKMRGLRIEPGEIEHAIIKHLQCDEAVVICQEDKNFQQSLVAYVVFKNIADKNNFSVKVAKLKQQLKLELPAYFIPDNFISLSGLPLLPNGKINFKALPKVHFSSVEKDESEYTETEKLVSKVWKEFLGTKNIGINDNFFLLGGHSLIAVEVMMRLEKETGIKLPLSSLFEYPTIKKFAALLTSDDKETVWKSLVPIKSTGSKMPVYIIHGSGSNILNFSSFALYVDEDQPVYGLQAKGLSGSDEPLNNMEEIASYYISEVLKHNPDGPYAIAGYSFGGYVAVEMAKQLRLMGKEVKMLAMFDTNAKEHFSSKGTYQKAVNKIVRQFKKAAWITSSLTQRPKETISYQISFIKHKTRVISIALGLAKREEPDGYLLELQRISEKNDIAYYNYRIQPFEGVVDLFKATSRLYFVDDFKYLGWKDYALKGVRVHDVPGDHRTMLLSPNDKVFARALQKALDNCIKE